MFLRCHGTMVPWHCGTSVPWYHVAMVPGLVGNMIDWVKSNMGYLGLPANVTNKRQGPHCKVKSGFDPDAISPTGAPRRADAQTAQTRRNGQSVKSPI